MSDDEDEPTPLTFICQIRCEGLAPFDPEGQLPHEGMLYFFAAIDEYLGDGDLECPFHNGIGEWDGQAYKVLYTPSTENLLQIDENDDWGLRLYDCGMINFLIRPEDLKSRRFDKTVVYFESL